MQANEWKRVRERKAEEQIQSDEGEQVEKGQ